MIPIKKEYIPVSSKINNNNELLSIKRLFPNYDASFSNLDENEKIFKNTTLLFKVLSINTSASLQISNIASNSLDFNAKTTIQEISAFTTKKVQNPGSIIKEVIFGCCFRMLVNVWDIKEQFKISYMTVASAVEAGIAKASYQISGIGIGYAGFIKILNGIEPFGILNYDKALLLSKNLFVEENDRESLFNSIDKSFVPFGVVLNDEKLFENCSKSPFQSIIYAMFCIQSGKTLKAAINENTQGYDNFLIQKTYFKMLSGLNDNNSETYNPTLDERKNAQDWLELK